MAITESPYWGIYIVPLLLQNMYCFKCLSKPLCLTFIISKTITHIYPMTQYFSTINVSNHKTSATFTRILFPCTLRPTIELYMHVGPRLELCVLGPSRWCLEVHVSWQG